MTQRELDRILELHEAFLKGQSEGERADLTGADLRGLNLSRRDLREVAFVRADVRGANFAGSRLEDADFSGANAAGANFTGAEMTNTNTSEANMLGARGTRVDSDNLNLGVVRRRRGHRTRQNEQSAFSFAMTPDYPRGWYHSVYHDLLGYPILTNTTPTVAAVKASPLSSTYAAHMAKYPFVTLMEHPFMDWRQDVATTIKNLAPVPGKCHIAWVGNLHLAFDVDASFDWTYGAKYLLYNGPPDLRLRAFDGSTWPAFGNGSYFLDLGPIKQQFLQAWLDRGATTRIADGFWIDWAWGNVSTASSGVDPSKTGYTTTAELDAASNAAMLLIMSGLKQYGEIWANGEMSETNRLNLTGRIRENMDPSAPFQDLAPDGFATYDAYLADCMLYMGAGVDGGGAAVCIASSNDSATLYTLQYNRVHRFCLGTACLCGGYGTIVGNNIGPIGTPMLQFADELSVDVATGNVDFSGAHIGWLGRPTERPTKDASGIWVRRFQNGIVLVNPTGQVTVDTKSITLERPYKRINGLHDLTVNNGAVETTVSVLAHDAVFMLRR